MPVPLLVCAGTAGGPIAARPQRFQPWRETVDDQVSFGSAATGQRWLVTTVVAETQR